MSAVARFEVICPACAVVVGVAADRFDADALARAAEHFDVSPEREPYVFDTWGVEEP